VKWGNRLGWYCVLLNSHLSSLSLLWWRHHCWCTATKFRNLHSPSAFEGSVLYTVARGLGFCGLYVRRCYTGFRLLWSLCTALWHGALSFVVCMHGAVTWGLGFCCPYAQSCATGSRHLRSLCSEPLQGASTFAVLILRAVTRGLGFCGPYAQRCDTGPRLLRSLCTAL
jgi:hypothetical protein